MCDHIGRDGAGMKHVSQHHGITVAADSMPSGRRPFHRRQACLQQRRRRATTMRTACPPLRRVLPPHRDTFRRQLGIGGGADRAGCNARPTNAPGCRVRVEIGGCGRAGGQRATQRLECDRRLDAADGRVEIPVRSRSSRARKDCNALRIRRHATRMACTLSGTSRRICGYAVRITSTCSHR
jgi:hypothetical protein